MNLTQVVAEFCAAHVGETITAAGLHNYVSGKVQCSPGSESRILRELRKKGVVSYVVPNRQKGIYSITAVS